MIKEHGFSLIEVLVAFTVLMSAITTLMPIISKLQLEQHILSERRSIAIQLHENLQQYIWSDDYEMPAETNQKFSDRDVHFLFVKENQFIKGCANWENAKERNETICFYGLPAS